MLGRYCCGATALHRFCVQCLGRMDDFLDYYQSNRRLQLNSDLSPPPNFIESYQKFIAQACCRLNILACGARCSVSTWLQFDIV